LKIKFNNKDDFLIILVELIITTDFFFANLSSIYFSAAKVNFYWVYLVSNSQVNAFTLLK